MKKNKKFVVLEGFKFGFKKKLAGNIDRWRYARRKCKSYLKINNLNSIVGKRIIHNQQLY